MDRFSGLVVILEDDLRDEDAQPIIAAIGQLRGVLDVRTVTSRPGLEMTLRAKIVTRLRERLEEALSVADGEG